MGAFYIVLFLCVSAVITHGHPLASAKLACEDLCSKCGGTGLIKDDNCECRFPVDKPDHIECLKEGLNTDGYLEWDPESEIRSQRSIPTTKISINALPSPEHKKRVPRRAQYFDVGYSPSHDLDYDAYDMFRNHRSQNGQENTEKSHVYEVYIGDDDEESLQLVFPDSNGLEVEHQYLFQNSDGEEHPCSEPIAEPELRENEMDTDGSWNSPYYQPRGQWNNQNPPKKEWDNNLDNSITTASKTGPWDYAYNAWGRNYNQQGSWDAPYSTNRL